MKEGDNLGKDNKKRKGKKIHKFDIKISFRNRGGNFLQKQGWMAEIQLTGED